MTELSDLEREMQGRLPTIPPKDDPELDETKWKPASELQIGGNHYKSMKIQPMHFSMVNKLDPLQHTIIKYVTRFRSKNGVQDLEKAKHCIDLLIQFELTGDIN